jgi:hypothetical protein
MIQAGEITGQLLVGSRRSEGAFRSMESADD